MPLCHEANLSIAQLFYLLLYVHNSYSIIIVWHSTHTLLSYRRVLDVERGLDRIECSVTQYSDPGESGVIVPVIDFVARFAARFHRFRSVWLFADPVRVSGQPEIKLIVWSK